MLAKVNLITGDIVWSCNVQIKSLMCQTVYVLPALKQAAYTYYGTESPWSLPTSRNPHRHGIPIHRNM